MHGIMLSATVHQLQQHVTIVRLRSCPSLQMLMLMEPNLMKETYVHCVFYDSPKYNPTHTTAVYCFSWPSCMQTTLHHNKLFLSVIFKMWWNKLIRICVGGPGSASVDFSGIHNRRRERQRASIWYSHQLPFNNM